MRLRRKLLLPLVIPILLLATVGIAGIASLLHLQRAAGTILADNYRSIRGARAMERALRSMDAGRCWQDRGQLGPRAACRAMAREFDEALAICEGNVTERGEAEVMAWVRSGWDELRPEPGGIGGAVFPAPRKGALEDLLAGIDEISAINEAAMFDLERRTQDQARQMVSGVASALGLTVLALALIAVVSARRIARPVTQVADRLHLALKPEGDGGPSARRDVDEIARLEAEMAALLARLSAHDDEQARRLDHVRGRLAFVMDEVQEGVVLMDAGHRLLEVNRVAAALLGWTPGAAVRLEDLPLPEHLRALLSPVIDGTFHAERDLGELRGTVCGSERVYRLRALPVSGPTEAQAGCLVLFWDVTDERRFEESRRQLVSTLAHQVKTPITSLSMSVSLLQERLRGVPPAEAELLSIARQDCHALAALVSDLIDAAREVTADLQMHARRVDLAMLLRAALRPLVPQARERRIELVLPPTGRPAHAAVDPVKFPWVVTNLVGNALRYTPPGGTVTVAIADLAGAVEVEVSDTGVGIAKENLERIFLPNVSADAEPRPGTHGLGLAIAREIVEAHGGAIAAASEVGKGTTFRIRLPTGPEATR